MFFWVFPRRQIEFCRRFGTLCQVHLQRLDVEYEVYFIPHIEPLKMDLTEEMDLTEGSETSEKNLILRRGNTKKNIYKTAVVLDVVYLFISLRYMFRPMLGHH
jgi:hypothetical protein